jgi:hypothetical protein
MAKSLCALSLAFLIITVPAGTSRAQEGSIGAALQSNAQREGSQEELQRLETTRKRLDDTIARSTESRAKLAELGKFLSNPECATAVRGHWLLRDGGREVGITDAVTAAEIRAQFANTFQRLQCEQKLRIKLGS